MNKEVKQNNILGIVWLVFATIWTLSILIGLCLSSSIISSGLISNVGLVMLLLSTFTLIPLSFIWARKQNRLVRIWKKSIIAELVNHNPELLKLDDERFTLTIQDEVNEKLKIHLKNTGYYNFVIARRWHTVFCMFCPLIWWFTTRRSLQIAKLKKTIIIVDLSKDNN